MARDLTNDQLHALWAVVVEAGDDGQKGYIGRDASFIIYLDKAGEEVRGEKFRRGSRGAIIHKTMAGYVDGKLYASAAELKKAWGAVDTETGRPPWKK